MRGRKWCSFDTSELIFTLLRNGMCGLWKFSLWSVDLYACQIENKNLETSLLICVTDADSSFDILPAVTAVNQC